jgi:hypothetical protein
MSPGERVKSFDGVPLDVDVTPPPLGDARSHPPRPARLGRVRTDAAGRATLRVRHTLDRHRLRVTKPRFRGAIARVRATGP